MSTRSKWEINFGGRWAELTQLSERIMRRGFDGERRLIKARHEIRGLACHHLGNHRYFVTAGDKSGHWYAAEFSFDDREGTSSPFVTLAPPPPPQDGRNRVIDDVLIVPWGASGYGIVLATRGNGAWIAALEHVQHRLARGEDGQVELTHLPESAGRKVHGLVHDAASQTLLAIAQNQERNELFAWSLETRNVRAIREEFPFAITCVAIDKADRRNEEDLLYVATARFELYAFPRPHGDAPFRVTAEELAVKAERKEWLWQGRLSPILRMRPLSDVRFRDPKDGSWRRTFPHRGVFGMTLRHLLVIYAKQGDPARCHARLVVGETKNLDLTILNLPETEDDHEELAGWHAVAVSTLERKLRIFRPSGIRRPRSGGFGLFHRDAPENQFPTHLISGYKDVTDEVLRDRVYTMQALSPPDGRGSQMGLVLGLGDHEVRWHRFKLRWRLHKEAREVAQQLVHEAPSIDLVLETLDNIALSSVYWREESRELVLHDEQLDPRNDKHTLLEVIPRLWRRCESEDHWHRFYLLIWDVLARRTPRYLAVGMIQALRRVQVKLHEELAGEELLRRQAELEEHVTRIRKFVLDPGHFSEKRTHFLELASSEDPNLQDERAVYRSILMARRHDPVFVTDFDQEKGLIGEVLTFTPLPPSRGSGNFWEVAEPGQIRFVATNYYGELWLLDGAGGARRCPIESLRASANPIHAVHVHGDALLLSFSDGQLRRLRWRQLPATARIADSEELQLELLEGIDRRSIAATAFAGVPGSDSASRLLWGDAAGGLHCLGQNEPLYEPPEYQRPDEAVISPSTAPGSRAVRQLAWFESTWPGGERRPYVLATTAGGQLLLFHWIDGQTAALTSASEMQLGSDPISALLVTGPQQRHVIVARYDTAVGLALIGEPDAPRLGLVWAFRTGDTVRSIQPVSPDLAQDGRPHRVLVGSHDSHLYALDLEGRHLETFSLRQDPLRRGSDRRDRGGFKVGLFVTAPPRQQEDDANVILRVYACAFENRYLGLRLIDRPRMLKAFDKTLEELEPRERELGFARWRAYHVEEGHLRHRFVLQSRRYPGTTPEEILHALDWLLEAGDTSFEPTGEMTALLRRLFRGQPGSDSKPLLADSALYRAAIKVLRDCDQRWDTPNSTANQRLMLFWIRSFLRQIKSRKTLRRWIEVGDQVALQGEPLAQPEMLLRRFLEQSDRLIQYKTLQYLERMIFGWPESGQEEPLFRRGEIRPSDLDWLLDALFSRLALRPEQVSRQEPSPVVLQIGRLLCRLIRDGHVDPLFLTYQIQRRSVAFDMYHILEDQLETIAATDSATNETDAADPVSILRRARRLDESLVRGAPLPEIVSHLEALMDRPWPETRGLDADYLTQAPRYFHTLLPLLRLESLEDFQLLATGGWEPPPTEHQFAFCPSYSYLAELRPLLQAVRDYYVKKFNDQWRPPVMTHLRFEDFHRVRCEWRLWSAQAQALLRDDPPALAKREALLLQRLLAQWERILIEREQKTALLQDFQNALEQHCFQDIEQSYRFDPEKVKQVQEEKALAFTAFSNLFIRLLLLAEPVEGAFLYRWKDEEESEEIRGRWFLGGGGTSPEVVELTAKSHPRWLPDDWSNPETFALLEETFHDLDRSKPPFAWKTEAISGTPDERGAVAYYVFGWDNVEAPGLVRFENQHLAWAVPLQALVYRRAAVEQVEFKGRVFSIIAHNLGSPVYHLRSDLRMLLDRRLEGVAKKVKRFEKYDQLLRQARHMDGIIDSIMSLSDREIEIQRTEVSIAQLTYDVVRTVRREASARNIQIEYLEPEEKLREQTTIHTDEPKVYDILMMILNNAVKYSPVGGQVFVEVDQKSRGVEVRITDHGPGIPDDERPHIYEAFFRGLSARSTASGLGLGLYTAKLYTRLILGHLNHRNHHDGGSTFDLFIPDLEAPDR